VPISRSPLGRPRVSTRQEIEEIAFDLLLRDGYAATTVEAITSAAGVSRTTLFRYFGSRDAIVWGEFYRAIERLRTALADSLDAPVAEAVQAAVVTSTRLSRDAAPDTWLDRFRVLDSDPALVADTGRIGTPGRGSLPATCRSVRACRPPRRLLLPWGARSRRRTSPCSGAG